VTQILGLLRSLARANQLEMVEEDGFVRLEASTAAASAAQDTTTQQEMRLHVYRLRHGRADRIGATLQNLFGAGRTAPASRTTARPSLSQSLRDQRIPPVETDTVAVAPPAPPQPDQGLRADIRGELQIVPDESTNSLLVRATATDWIVIEQAIQALDLRPLQVLIEVVIAEVRRTKDLDVGVSFQATDTRNAGRTTETKLEGGGSDDFTVRFSRTGTVDIDVLLSALSASGDVRILSRPVVLAQNNQEARILVGSERPFVQVFRSLPTDGAIRDQVVQYRDVGTSLSILPTINPDGYVNLQITQEVSTATAETQFGAPVISTREAATHLLARSGQTVVLGGLIEHQRDWARTGIPLLKDIPVLGALFGTTRTTSGSAELFLFLTPHVVETDDDADYLRDELERASQLPLRLEPIRSIIPRRMPPDTTGVGGGGR
jgi:general secretion pathway protein D